MLLMKILKIMMLLKMKNNDVVDVIVVENDVVDDVVGDVVHINNVVVLAFRNVVCIRSPRHTSLK